MVSSLTPPLASRRDSEIDLIEELRLRHWARLNYVPRRDRSPAWHPIILDEMQIKDRDIHPGTGP